MHYPSPLCRLGIAIVIAFAASPDSRAQVANATAFFPANKATAVNPDTHLVLTFPSAPTLGKSGKIRIYDAADHRLVDTLDLAIPPGPAAAGRGGAAGPARGTATGAATAPAPTAPAARAGAAPPAGRARAQYTPVPYEYKSGHFTNANTVPGTPSGLAEPTSRDYQLTIIGGFTDGFHFYPVIIHDNVATIYPHNNLLDYGRSYYVQIDPGVLTLADGSFTGIAGETGWSFATRKNPPPADAERVVVAADGSGDFNTVQGAMDFIPDYSPRHVTVFIRNGTYEEIVYFRNKTNVTMLGEDRAKVLVFYANSETFNPHPANLLTNEWPGTFPSRRAAFMVDHSSGIDLVNLTIKTTVYGQAEGLLIVGGKNIVSHVDMTGTGDALQINDSVYFTDSHIVGAGDSILGRGPSFFRRCEINSRGVFMWIRNTDASHGNVFVDCKFQSTGPTPTEIARAPMNGGRGYPHAEVVLLDCALGGFTPALWGTFGGDMAGMHLWEYHSTNLSDGQPADMSQREPGSKQLTMEHDAETIAHYRDPAYVLGGWSPAMAPLILTQPSATTTAIGRSATFTTEVAAIPDATYQWYENDAPIQGATAATLTVDGVKAGDAARYTVVATNASGSITSHRAILTVR